MKIPILLLCSFLCLQVVFGQRTLFIPPDRVDTISHIFRERRAWYTKMEMTPLQTTTAEYSLRIATYSVIIDVWKEGGRDTAVVTNWVREYIPEKSDKKPRFFSKMHALSKEQATAILRFKNMLQIDTIPDAFYIDNWPERAGTVYSIECSDSKSYYFKSYTSPSEDDAKVPESVNIAKFIAYVWQIADVEALSKQLTRSSPFARFYNSEGVITGRGIALP